MTIFAILMPTPQPRLVDIIKQKFPNDHYAVNETQFLISTTGTTIDLSAALGVYDAKNPTLPATGLAVILSVSSYFGRAPQPIWDWMKAKLEASPRG